MLRQPLHLSDQEILLVLDGEVSRGRAKHAQTHLASCWLCRSRMGEMERTIEDFVSVHRRSGDPGLPSIDGARALLKARLGEAAATPTHRGWPRFLQLVAVQRTAAAVCVVVALTLAGAKLLSRDGIVSQSQS